MNADMLLAPQYAKKIMSGGIESMHDEVGEHRGWKCPVNYNMSKHERNNKKWEDEKDFEAKNDFGLA